MILLVEAEKGWSTTLGMKKSQRKYVQQWGILVNGQKAELVTWMNDSFKFKELIDLSNKVLYTYW